MNTKPDISIQDGLQGLLSLPEGSADLILTDIPSGVTQALYDDLPDLDRLFPACWKALKESGILVVIVSHLRIASELVLHPKANFRYDYVWEKSAATGFLNAAYQPLKRHEHVLVFCRVGRKRTYNIEMLQGFSPVHAATRRENSGKNYGKKGDVTKSRAGATDRYPNSILTFGVVGTRSKSRIHHQQKPVDLLRRMIRVYSNPGDLVVDPFAGSGSTGYAALEEGRTFLGFDLVAY